MIRNKGDVDERRDGPAVNVKTHGPLTRVSLPLDEGSSYPAGHPELIEHHMTSLAFTHDWIEEHLTDEDVDMWWQAACESAWEDLQNDAETIFGPHVKVYSDGRSGGWAVVHGLDDVESWDAIALGKWRTFHKWARAAADDIPRATVDLIYHNVFVVDQDEAEARIMRWAALPEWVRQHVLIREEF